MSLSDDDHRRIHPGIRPNYTGEYGGLAAVYRKQGLSEKQIAKRIISNATRAIEGEKVLDECNKKGILSRLLSFFSKTSYSIRVILQP